VLKRTTELFSALAAGWAGDGLHHVEDVADYGLFDAESNGLMLRLMIGSMPHTDRGSSGVPLTESGAWYRTTVL
jgi:hypothetical protein